jgi:predicted metal-dependent hydrolase
MTERPRDGLGRPLPADSSDEQPPLAPPLSDEDAWRRGIALIEAGSPFAAHELFELRWRDVNGPDRQAWQALAKWGAALTHEARGNALGARSVAAGAQGLLETAPTLPECVDIARVRDSCARLARS